MSRTFHLHIGSPKTATSLVQRHFATSTTLARNGIVYPQECRLKNGVAHHPVASAVLSGDVLEATAGLRTDLAGDEDILISSEGFINCITTTPRMRSFEAFLAQLCGHVDEVHVIVFLREASSFFESMYLHTAKAVGIGSSFDEYLAARKKWYRDLFKNLRRISRSKLPVRLTTYAFQPDRYSADWNAALRIDTGIDTSARINPRLSLKSQMLLKEFENFRNAYGSTFERRDAIRKLYAMGSPFENDILDFTLYRPGIAGDVHRRALSWASRFGCAEYVAAFGSPPTPAGTHAEIDYAMLTRQDLECARDFLLQ